MPRYDEMAFFDKIPVKGKDLAKASKSPIRVSLIANRDFEDKMGMISGYGELASSISVKEINYSFTPKVFRKGLTYFY